jgi:FtsP/CotA-like multicopper oxidase with cupredoxin domain
VSGVHTAVLDAREVVWYPEANDGAAVPMYAFGEQGRRSMIPAPMLRVPVGTEMAITVRNSLAKPLKVFGLHGRGTAPDSLLLAPGETREARFRADLPGTYFYFGRTEPLPVVPGPGMQVDAGLFGAFIVDSAGAAPASSERVLVITGYYDSIPGIPRWTQEQHRLLRREFIRGDVRAIVGVNGKSWPHSERLTYAEGDTVRWRVINVGPFPHPMHLHGFHYRIDARGSHARDTVFAPERRRYAVTENMTRGTTMSMTWVAERPGNWLFHCHLVTHIVNALRLPSTAHHPATHGNHAESEMAGLVVGVHVTPKNAVTLTGNAPRRRLRLFVTERENVYAERPAMSYVLQEGPRAPAADSIRTPSSTLFLRQHEPTDITVINRSRQRTTVHWHGMELESLFDGVGDWSGWGRRVAPSLAPGDSFVVRLTPPRAGTFMYHTHMDEGTQLASGLFGAMVVVPAGGVVDTTDRVILLGMGGPNDDALPTINGSTSPAPIELRAGVAHRLRVINISPSESRTVELFSGGSLTSWRALAKDAADLPTEVATSRSARQLVIVGETYDFEILRQQPESLTLRIVGPNSVTARMAFRAEAEVGQRVPLLTRAIPVIVR